MVAIFIPCKAVRMGATSVARRIRYAGYGVGSALLILLRAWSERVNLYLNFGGRLGPYTVKRLFISLRRKPSDATALPGRL